MPDPSAFEEYRAETLDVVNRQSYGWAATRDGFGFLMWNRGDVWERMTSDEAAVFHAAWAKRQSDWEQQKAEVARYQSPNVGSSGRTEIG